MAKIQVSNYAKKTLKRKGIHAKSKHSCLKSSKNYKKNIEDRDDKFPIFTLILTFKT